MSIDRIAQLKTLHLFGMAAALHEWQTEYSFQQKAGDTYTGHLCRKFG
jgi:hypothetical protein